MYGEMTDKTTIAYLEQCLDAHSMEQFEILLYKKTRKILTVSLSELFVRLTMFRCRPCLHLLCQPDPSRMPSPRSSQS